MKKHYQRLAVLIVFGIVGWVPSVFAQTDFYKGKTITVYIGTTPGALYDQWGRILAQHMGKHIPGKPDMKTKTIGPKARMRRLRKIASKTVGGALKSSHRYNNCPIDRAGLLAREIALTMPPIRK